MGRRDKELICGIRFYFNIKHRVFFTSHSDKVEEIAKEFGFKASSIYEPGFHFYIEPGLIFYYPGAYRGQVDSWHLTSDLTKYREDMDFYKKYV